MKKSRKVIIAIVIIILLIIIGVIGFILIKNKSNSNKIINSLDNQNNNMEKENIIKNETATTEKNATTNKSTKNEKEHNNNVNMSTFEKEVSTGKDDIKNYIFNKEWISELDDLKNEKKENVNLDSDSKYYLLKSDRGGMPIYIVNLNVTVSNKAESGEEYKTGYSYILLISHNGTKTFCEVVEEAKSGFDSISASKDGRVIRSVITKKGVEITTDYTIYEKDNTISHKTILTANIDEEKYHKTVYIYDEKDEDKDISKSEYDNAITGKSNENFVDFSEISQKLIEENF